MSENASSGPGKTPTLPSLANQRRPSAALATKGNSGEKHTKYLKVLNPRRQDCRLTTCLECHTNGEYHPGHDLSGLTLDWSTDRASGKKGKRAQGNNGKDGPNSKKSKNLATDLQLDVVPTTNLADGDTGKVVENTVSQEMSVADRAQLPNISMKTADREEISLSTSTPIKEKTPIKNERGTSQTNPKPLPVMGTRRLRSHAARETTTSSASPQDNPYIEYNQNLSMGPSQELKDKYLTSTDQLRKSQDVVQRSKAVIREFIKAFNDTIPLSYVRNEPFPGHKEYTRIA
ncbi:hypothetical protein ONZ43_g4731 [Nemania bipapillata]|uniref:Uncharacterized protein n=1 Tax=Nemania bipapillata TaxID=110536 RepID=A0ACC2IIY2_9PEZI|nr:hypothetical protein ONZ43_g4731 [Nemania bipapillata]